ncbi:MAG: hypothetical protein CK426_00440 [Legionella sp.]|nr:MAG: hypothetical protein CK423_09145 [Legionella sp.]PJE00138.1 MAG: hypothetical protein CK426_00440 [Legionella sp.]
MAELDEKTIEALDELFNAWLVMNGIVNQDGTLYQADGEGTILSNQQGEPMRVHPEQFQSLINDPGKGFSSFVAKKGLRVNTIQRDYPEE